MNIWIIVAGAVTLLLLIMACVILWQNHELLVAMIALVEKLVSQHTLKPAF